MAKVRVRYVGSNDSALLSDKPEVPSIQFNRYGQLVEMDEQLYFNIVSGKYGAKLALMLDEDFQALGHTDRELVEHANPATHTYAPEEFRAKVAEANRKVLEIHSAASET